MVGEGLLSWSSVGKDGFDEETARTVWKDTAKDFVGMMSSSMAGTLEANTTSAVVVTE